MQDEIHSELMSLAVRLVFLRVFVFCLFTSQKKSAIIPVSLLPVLGVSVAPPGGGVGLSVLADATRVTTLVCSRVTTLVCSPVVTSLQVL